MDWVPCQHCPASFSWKDLCIKQGWWCTCLRNLLGPLGWGHVWSWLEQVAWVGSGGDS